LFSYIELLVSVRRRKKQKKKQQLWWSSVQNMKAAVQKDKGETPVSFTENITIL